MRTSTTRSPSSPFPAVLKPVDSGGQRAVFRIETRDELERDLADAIEESPTDEALLEGFVDGIELNGIVIARGGEPAPITLSDRLRPPGVGFGVGWIHVYPPSIPPEQLRLAEEVAVESVRALGLRDAIAFPQLIASPDGSVAVVEVAARIPGGQMADLVRHAVGVDLVDVALRQALGEDVPDEVALPRFTQPLAIRFFTAQPGPASDRRGDEDRQPRRRSRVRGRRAGGHLPPGRRDDPPRPPRRRPPWLRHRSRRTRPPRPSPAPSSPRRGSRSRSAA